MFRPKIPSYIRLHAFEFKRHEEVPVEVYRKIREGFASQLTGKPLVSVNIIAWNEESNILRNLSSLSAIKSRYPVEFIYVDNNSTDKTSEIIRQCGIEPVTEKSQGYGFARQAALEHSQGTYILTGDADTIYPPAWVDTMVKPLLEGKGIASFGIYSFIPGREQSRLRFAVYEFFRDIIHSLRSRKHPELVTGGVNFCFPREEALRIGFIRSDSRMEDGQMAMALMKKGKLVRITSSRALAWTVTRSVDKSGTLLNAVFTRIIKELGRIRVYFSKKY